MNTLIDLFSKFNLKNYDLNKIIIIQKHYRGYLQRRKLSIVSSSYQTKEWRKNQKWYKNGKHNECEIHQLQIIRSLFKNHLKINTKFNMIKTNERLNFETNEIINIKNIYNQINPFSLTENFDCKIYYNQNEYYFNLKFIVGDGGAQNRSLREIYHFIVIQFEYKLKNSNEKYIINILDGDLCSKKIHHFKKIYNNPKYKNIKKYIFIGDMFEFQSYFFSSIK